MINSPHGKIIFTGPSERGWHRLQLASECLQKYRYTYGEGQGSEKKKAPSSLEDIEEDRGPEPLVRGSLLHLMLAQHYKIIQKRQQVFGGCSEGEGIEDTDPDAWCPPIDALKIVAERQKRTELIPTLEETYLSYCRAHPPSLEEERMQIVGVESLGQTQVGKYRITGRLDLIYRDLSGRLCVVDHKTTARYTPRHPDYYALSGQFFTYHKIAKEKHPDLHEMMVNFIQPATKSASAKFTRSRFPVSRRVEATYEKSVLLLEEAIESQKDSSEHTWPKAMSELVCFPRYGECPYVDRCLGRRNT